MEPSSHTIDDIMHPTAIFTNAPDIENYSNDEPCSWNESHLNPRNRPDCLDFAQTISWHVDGAEIRGTRFFVVPDFAVGRPPVGIDTFIPDQCYQLPPLKYALKSSTLTTRSKEAGTMPISRHIVRALDFWSRNYPQLENDYFKMPYGSQIIIETVSSDIKNMKILLSPSYEVEQQWLSLKTLQSMWLLPQNTWPEVLELDKLRFQRQMHDSISIVTIEGLGSTTFVFKSLISDLKCMYHELKMLLTMDPHPNIMRRPLYLITKKGRFGGKTGVCGFILQHYGLGSLRDRISAVSGSNQPHLRDQLRWVRQITSALIHIKSISAGFYSNLKLDNIVLSSTDGRTDGRTDAIMIDFEQRSSSYAWLPPEVYYREHLEYLATSDIPKPAKAYYTKLLRTYDPQWKPLLKTTKYQNSLLGYSAGWLALTPREVESAQTFMLGKLMWCIFEGVGFPNSAITIETFQGDFSNQQFPEFKRTPLALMKLIKRCTAGAPEWHGRYSSVVRRGNKLYPRGRTGLEGEPLGMANETQEAATLWWKEELKNAEVFLERYLNRREGREGLPEDDVALAFLDERPTLNDVLLEMDRVDALLLDSKCVE